MAKVQVKALRLGYYNHKRQREGSVFHMEDGEFHKDAKGKPVFPSWVEPVGKKKYVEVEEPEKKLENLDDDVI